MTFMENRIPPQAIDAEESLLAYCLLRDASEVVDAIKQDDFYKTVHRIIFQSICDLQKKGEPVELLSVVNHLRDNNELEKVGGAAHVARFADAIPIDSSIEYYIKIVKDKAVLRKLIEESSNICCECYDAINAESMLDNAQKRIVGIDYETNKDPFVKVSDTLVEYIEDLENRQRGEITGIKAGFNKLDLLLGGFQKTDSIIIGARPSMGKTSLVMNIIDNISVKQGIPSAIVSLEMSKKQLTGALVCGNARVDGGRIRNSLLNKDDWNRITEAAGRINDAPIFIDDRTGLHYMEVRRALRKLKKKHDIQIAAIDYIQLMEGDKDNKRTGEVGSISRAIKNTAKELDIPILALCQLNRKLEERADKRPVLSDLRDSGEIEQDADVVIFIYRDEMYNTDENNPYRGTAELLIRKHREGPTGMVPLAFLKAYRRFENLGYDY